MKHVKHFDYKGTAPTDRPKKIYDEVHKRNLETTRLYSKCILPDPCKHET